MGIILVAPPALWGVDGVGMQGSWSYFDLQKQFLGPSAATFPGEHLGLRSMEAYALDHGVEVTVVNGQTSNHRTLDETWSAIEDAVAKMTDVSVIGFTGTCEMYPEVQYLAGRVKDRYPEIPTLVGHDFGTLNARKVLETNPDIDFIIRGEGERSATELAQALRSRGDVSQVPNLIYRRPGGGIAVNPMHSPLDLDAIPVATRGDLAAVTEMGLAAAVFTTRGCPYKCTYCTTGALGDLLPGEPAYRFRSVTRVVDEIETLVTEHGLRHVTVVDDLFVSKQKASQERAVAFAQEIIRRGLQVSLKVDCRIDSVDPAIFGLLARAGLSEVFVGIETSSDSQLENYRKTYSVTATSQESYIREQVGILRDLGIAVSPGIIAYHPKVTREELRLTADLIDFLGYRATYPFWSTIMAYPGTPLYTEYVKADLLDVGWPVPEWRFVDPRASRHYSAVKSAAQDNRFDFEYIRDAFRRGLDSWDMALEGAAP